VRVRRGNGRGGGGISHWRSQHTKLNISVRVNGVA
jgi:hypothetical protein